MYYKATRYEYLKNDHTSPNTCNYSLIKFTYSFGGRDSHV